MITILSGDNDYEIAKNLHSLMQKYIKEHGELALEKIEPADVSTKRLYDAVHSVPFLASKKMVVINGPPAKEVLESIAELDVPESTDLVLSIGKPDKRASYYKKLSKLAGFKEFAKNSVQNIPVWVVNVAKEYGATISSSDARFLIDRIGPDQMLLASEIDKLALYDKKITKQSIELLTELTPQSTVFQLLDAAFKGNFKLVEELYQQQRTQKVEPLAIVGILAWQLHVVALVKYAGKKTSSDIAKDAKINPYTVTKSQAIAKNVSTPVLKRLVSDLSELDNTLKTKKINADEALLNYLFSLAV